MDDVARLDLRLFLKELFSPLRLVILIVSLTFLWTFPLWRDAIAFRLFASCIFSIVWVSTSYSASMTKRFKNRKYAALWSGCTDRLKRFEEVSNKLRKSSVADLTEMPSTVRAVGKTLYKALRKADVIAHEI